MAKLQGDAYVHVTDMKTGQSGVFAPGDDLPGWTDGLIGADLVGAKYVDPADAAPPAVVAGEGVTWRPEPFDPAAAKVPELRAYLTSVGVPFEDSDRVDALRAKATAHQEGSG